MFVAGLEGISEIFISGVEVEDSSPQIKKEKELGGLITDDMSTTTETTLIPESFGGTKNGNGGIIRKPVGIGAKGS